MRTTAKGSAGENRAATWLEERGWVVASRRHRLGGGDLMAVTLLDEGWWRVLLAEVKATQRPWQTFGPADRNDLLETASRINAEAALIWTPNARRIELIPSTAWPGS